MHYMAWDNQQLLLFEMIKHEHERLVIDPLSAPEIIDAYSFLPGED